MPPVPRLMGETRQGYKEAVALEEAQHSLGCREELYKRENLTMVERNQVQLRQLRTQGKVLTN